MQSYVVLKGIFNFQERTSQQLSSNKSILKRVSSDMCLHHLTSVEARVTTTNSYLMVPLEMSQVVRIQRMKSNSFSAPLCTCTKRNSIQINNKDAQVPAEKSSLILVTIVLLFIVTHSYRLALKLYEVLNPDKNTYENFQKCYSIGR